MIDANDWVIIAVLILVGLGALFYTQAGNWFADQIADLSAISLETAADLNTPAGDKAAAAYAQIIAEREARDFYWRHDADMHALHRDFRAANTALQLAQIDALAPSTPKDPP